MIFLQLAAAYLTLFAAGLGVTLLTLRGPSNLNVLECGSLAWLFGTGVVSLLLWIFGRFASGLMLQALVTIGCLALALAGWRTKTRADAKFRLPLPRGVIEWLLAIVILVEIGTIFFVSGKHTLGWDGLLNWEIKARYAFLNGGAIPAEYYSNAGRAFSHPEYPLGIPFTELWLYLWIGEAHQFWAKTIFPIFYAAASVLLTLFVARLSGRRWCGLLVAALLPFVPYLTAGPGGALVGYADFPLSVFYLAALGYLLSSLGNGEHYRIVYVSCLTLLPWIKREGLILWIVLVLLGLAIGRKQKKLRFFIFAALPGVILISAWSIYLNLRGAVASSDLLSPTVSLLRDNLNRTIPIFRAVAAEVMSHNHWTILWLLTAIALVYLIFLYRNMQNVILASAILLPIVAYSLTYLLSNWPSYTAHVTASFPRLLLHLVPAAWFAIGIALASVRHKSIDTSGAG